MVRKCDDWHVARGVLQGSVHLRNCVPVQEGDLHLCSPQYKVDRDLQGYRETGECNVKSLGVMTGKRRTFFLEYGFLKKNKMKENEEKNLFEILLILVFYSY